VFLIRALSPSNKVVFDPNDPGAPLPCGLDETDAGLVIRWRCRYRDTDQITAQYYLMIEKSVAFQRGFRID